MRISFIILIGTLTSLVVKGQEGDSLRKIARVFYNDRDYGKALEYEKKAAETYIGAKDLLKASNAFSNAGLMFYLLGRYDSSLFYYNRSLQIDLELGNERRIISRYKNIGITSKRKGDYIQAARSYTDALELSENSGNRKEVGSILNSMANLLIAQQKPMEALKYYKKSSGLLIQLGDTSGYIKAINNIGSVFFQTGDYDSARYFYLNALNLKSERGTKEDISPSLHNMGEVFMAMGEVDSAAYYLNRAYDERLRSSDARGIALTTNVLAKLGLSLRRYSEVTAWLNEARINLRKSGSRNLWAENHKLRSVLYDSLEMTDSAYHYFRKWKILQDSLFQTEKLAVLDQLNAYEKGVVEAEKIQAEQEVSLQKQINRQQRYLVFGIVAMVLILAFSLLLISRSRKRLSLINRQLDDQNILMQELNLELETLNRDIKHRKQNDYSRLLATIDLMMDDTDQSSELLSPLQSVIHAAHNIDDFLDHKARSKELYMDVYINELVDKLIVAHALSARGFSLSTDIQHVLVNSNKASAIAYIVSELINNTSKHVKPEKGKTMILLNIQLADSGEQLEFLYSDTGQDEQAAEKLRASAGLGWSILKRFVASLNTVISVERDKGVTRVGFSFNYK